jgi:hypothetical protein
MSSEQPDVDPFTAEISRIKAEREAKKQAHAQVMASKDYQDAWKFVQRATFDFIRAIQACCLMSTRAPEIYNEMLVFRMAEDLLQSTLATLFLTENGMHNPVRRELRYMIEGGVKNLFVDQQKPAESIEKRLEFLLKEVDNSSISMADQLALGAFDPPTKKLFIDEMNDVYYKMCAYVHPSSRQIEEQIVLAEAGKAYGFETAEELRDIGKLVFRTYDMLLVLFFHGLGLGLAGDVLVQMFDDEESWKFHKAKYMKLLSSHFDYKVERQEKKV